MATTTTYEPTTYEPTTNGVHGSGSGTGTNMASGSDRIEKGNTLTHTATNISLSPELFEKVFGAMVSGRTSAKP
jgi:hypothetical protein